jgi:hypothetical protein
MSKTEKTIFAMSVLITVLALLTGAGGQTDCEEGNGPLLSTQPPAGISVADIIQRFAAKESVFQAARNGYTYTQDTTIQTVDGHTVDGELRQVQDINLDQSGNRVVSVTFAPQPTITRIMLSKEEIEDLFNYLARVPGTSDLSDYDLHYVGQQHVDEIDTYVFDIGPKKVGAGKNYFEGRVWVDNLDYEVVKTCDKGVPGAIRAMGDTVRSFVSYREQIDGQYWFPTYIRMDASVHTLSGDVSLRVTSKYTNYKRGNSKSAR